MTSLHWVLSLLVYYHLIQQSVAIVEGLSMDPVNMNGFEIGELSMPQFVFLLLLVLQLILLYAVGVLPLEYDLAGALEAAAGNSTTIANAESLTSAATKSMGWIRHFLLIRLSAFSCWFANC